MLNIHLDDEAERYLVEILKEEKITASELVMQLLKDRLSRYRSKQTVLERMGGVPEAVLSAQDSPEKLSDRDTRKAIISEHIQARSERRKQVG